jgi:3D (Asp-Asp-Asp) domain-containing protein
MYFLMILTALRKRLTGPLASLLISVPVLLASSADHGWAAEKLAGAAAVKGAAKASAQQGDVVKLKVTATAYNSLPDQTQGKANIGAWGHRLKPGLKAIAVSRDLLAMGLEPGSEVEIVGLPGRYRVLDKMNSRWARKIDIYMGVDQDAALAWGRRPVVIRWNSEDS